MIKAHQFIDGNKLTESFVEKISVIIFLPLLIFCTVIYSQDYQFLESLLDEIDEKNEENLEWIEFLWELIENPLDLNKISENDLNNIPFITPEISQKIIKYRRKNNGFKKVEELSKITDLSEELYEALRPFVTTRSNELHKSITNRFRTRYELPGRRGFLENVYGNRWYLQNRLLFNIDNRIYGGFFFEKDAGEPNITDYVSYHFKYKNNQKGLSLLIGDYYMRVGKGLILSSAYGMPMSLYLRSSSLISNYQILENKSSNEFNFLKGISLFKTLRKNICLNLFYSSRSLDAKLSDDRTFVNSFSTSGLHRTENERNKIGKWDTDILGIVVNNTFSIINTQLSFIKTDQGLPFRNIDQDQYHLSFSYSGKMKSLLPGGEIALFQNKYPAIQQTLNFTHENTNYDIIIYYYHPQYFALFGKSFASMSEIPQNKIGIAFLLNHRFTKGTKIGAYAHFYRDAHNGEELPFFNRNYFLEISQKIQNHQIKIQFKQKYRKNRTLIISDRNKMIQTLRLSYHLNLSQRFLIQNRAEFSRANPLDKLNRYYGVLIYHQLNWQINRSWRILTRWTTFDIPDYDLRLYETEPDLPGIFRTTLLYNRGYKMIFLVRWLPVKNIQFDLKYQQRFYPDLKKIGSGWDEFNSNRIHEIKLSFILRYN